MNNPLNLNLNLQQPNSEPPTPVLIPAQHFGIKDSGPDDYVFRIDNSTLEIFQSCPRGASFYVIQRRTSPGSAALTLGTAGHHIEHFYRNGFTPEILDQTLQKVATYYTTPEAITDEWRTQLFAENLIRQYYDRFKTTEYVEVLIDPSTGSRMVEVPFELCLGTVDFEDTINCDPSILLGKYYDPSIHQPDQMVVNKIYCYWIGRIDLAITHLNANWVLDHKTASRLGNTFWEKFKTSSQMKGYTWALQEILQSPVEGVYINVLVVRKPTKTGCSLDFQRQPFRYSPSEISEWKKDTMTTIADFLSHLHRDYFPASPCNCVRWYGLCPYFSVCELQPEHRLPLLNSSQYVPVTWDPTSER